LGVYEVCRMTESDKSVSTGRAWGRADTDAEFSHINSTADHRFPIWFEAEHFVQINCRIGPTG